MIKRIEIQNIGSILDNAELEFSKGRYTFNKHMVINDIVNPIGIFGDNASGKTVLLRALDSLRTLLIEESRESLIFIPYVPRGFDKASKLELDFFVGKELYTYSISSFNNGILSEELSSKDFNVIRTSEDFNIYYEGELIKDGKIESKNYSIIRQLGIEEYSTDSPLKRVKSVFSFLSNITYIDVRGNVFGKIVKHKSINKVLEEKSSQVKELLESYDEFPKYDIRIKKASSPLEHEALEFSFDGKTYLPEALMSNGMKTHSTLLSTILTLEKGSVLIVDEIERSLHPFVAKQFIDELNEKFDVQIIFSSHNTSLLQEMRPDQIFFSKWDKKNNTSRYRKLSDLYSGIREINNIEKMYHGGLFDE